MPAPGTGLSGRRAATSFPCSSAIRRSSNTPLPARISACAAGSRKTRAQTRSSPMPGNCGPSAARASAAPGSRQATSTSPSVPATRPGTTPRRSSSYPRPEDELRTSPASRGASLQRASSPPTAFYTTRYWKRCTAPEAGCSGKSAVGRSRHPAVPSYRDERQRQGREEHGDNDAEGCGYAGTVGQRPQDEGGHQDGPSPADGEPRGGRVAVSWHRGDGRRDPQGVDAADA